MKITRPDDCSHSELDAARLALILIVGALAAERKAAELRLRAAALSAQRVLVEAQIRESAQREREALDGIAAGTATLAIEQKCDELRSRYMTIRDALRSCN